MLFLFEASTARLRAGTEVNHDEAWKEQVKKNEGLVLSIDGIQPDTGNETIYLVRDVLTGRILTAENVTESTKERTKQVLAPVVALGLEVDRGEKLRPIHGITSRRRSVAGRTTSNLSVSCHSRSGTAYFRAGSAHQDGDAHPHATKDA